MDVFVCYCKTSQKLRELHLCDRICTVSVEQQCASSLVVNKVIALITRC